MMSIWRAVLEGFTDEVLTAAASRVQALPQSNRPSQGRFDRLCRELGWAVDEREAGGAALLHFNNRSGGVRKVRIADGDDVIVTFSAHGDAAIPARKVTGEVLAYLLCRNIKGSGLGKWGICPDEHGNITFHLVYQALGGGLDAPTLKYICESLVGEAVDFDGKLRAAGLLR
jgi:hypothetical protein